MIGTVNSFLIFRSRIGFFNGRIAFSGLLRGFHTIVVHVLDLCVGQGDIQAAQKVDHGDQRIKIYGGIVCDIQIQAGIQHGNGLFRASVCVGGVCFGVGIVSNVQEGISIHRHQLNVLCIVIYTGNDDGIAVFRTQFRVFVPVVDPKQGVGTVSGHLGSFLIYEDLFLLQHRLFDLVQPCHDLPVYIQPADKKKQDDDLKGKQYFSFFSSHDFSPYLYLICIFIYEAFKKGQK